MVLFLVGEPSPIKVGKSWHLAGGPRKATPLAAFRRSISAAQQAEHSANVGHNHRQSGLSRRLFEHRTSEFKWAAHFCMESGLQNGAYFGGCPLGFPLKTQKRDQPKLPSWGMGNLDVCPLFVSLEISKNKNKRVARVSATALRHNV